MPGDNVPSNVPSMMVPFFIALRDVRLMFAYRGPLSDHLTDGIISISEHTVSGQEEMSRVNRKVSFLLVECFQNILKHGEKSPDGNLLSENAVFSFRAFDDSFYINSINPLKPEDRDRLAEMVERVNRMDRAELKTFYKQQLEENAISSKGGAGLGLIELARKSGQPIRYDFEEEPSGMLLFHNQVYFRKNSQRPEFSFTEATKKLRFELIRHRILLIYKGDFSQGAILPLLDIIELNVGRNSSSSETRRVGHVLIELLQNIGSHAAISADGTREGMLAISREAGAMVIRTVNGISEDADPSALKKRLDELKNKDTQTLKRLHRERFKASLNSPVRSSSGLGLIQIAKAAKGQIDYSIHTEQNGERFFSLSVRV